MHKTVIVNFFIIVNYLYYYNYFYLLILLNSIFIRGKQSKNILRATNSPVQN